MGKPLMIQEQDNQRIERLKKQLRIRTKVGVLRSALDLLEKEALKTERVAQWKRAARLIGNTSNKALRDFQPHSLMRRNE
ncbi:MAG: hypothetical protein ACE5G9_12920 [Nitrospinales bacterium]